MNKQQLLAAAEVMRRAAEGEPVQAQAQKLGKWFGVGYPNWDWSQHDFRIAPKKPREVYIHDTDLTSNSATAYIGGTIYGPGWNTFREVSTPEQTERHPQWREVDEG